MVRTGHHFNIAATWHDDDRVIGLSDAAIALWTMAGSYCVDHIADPGATDGRVTLARVRRLRPSTGEKAAAELVDAGLWKKLRGKNSGWQFADWGAEQQTKAERTSYLESESQRKRRRKRTPKTAINNQNTRSGDESSARKPAGTPSGTPPGKPPEVQAATEVRGKKRDLESQDQEQVDGHLRAQRDRAPAREPVDNSSAAGRAARCTEHQTAAASGECPGCVKAAIHARAAAVRADALDAARAAAAVAAACPRCHGGGWVGSMPCNHKPLGGRERAEAALRAAQAAGAANGADAPSSDEEQPSGRDASSGVAERDTGPVDEPVAAVDPPRAAEPAALPRSAAPAAYRGSPDPVVNARIQRHLAREKNPEPPSTFEYPGAAS